MRPDEGQAAPDFTLPRDGGGSVTLSALRGRPVVIFVYSEAGSPTCTDEARAFSAAAGEFAAAGIALFGLSPDPVARQEKFRDKQGLVVPLLSDEGALVCNDWGLWVEKQMFGRRYMGVERTTFLIDAQGTIARVWRKVRLKNHVAEVLAAAKAL